MKFVNNTLINPDAVADDIPVIQGEDYYIDNQGIVCTYNQKTVTVLDMSTGQSIAVNSINQVTENLYIINGHLCFRMSTDVIIYTSIMCSNSVYKGAFQGIVGFTEGETDYQFINNQSVASNTKFTGRINASKHLEIKVGNNWYVPNGEFRCYIDETFFCIDCNSTLPNSFGSTFDVTLASWTEVTKITEKDPTNYIKDILIQGNTLYLSTRKQLIGSEPFDWSEIDTAQETVIWSEDSRFINCNLAGEATADILYAIDYKTNTIYVLNSSNFNYLNSYDHIYQMTAVNAIDKNLVLIIDRQFVTIINFYQQLNNYLVKTMLQYEFKQMSAYEDLPSGYIFEECAFIKSINTIAIKSSYRQNMLIYVNGNIVSSICLTSTYLILSDYNLYLVDNEVCTQYAQVEDNSTYNDLDEDIKTYNSCIYIGSDLEADMGGATQADTQIIFEGKIAIEDEQNFVLVESSGDKPIAIDYPVRTNQSNPSNNWYLYSKTLRLPVDYTTWLKITMMPTTRIYNISLINQTQSTNNSKNTKRRRKHS